MKNLSDAFAELPPLPGSGDRAPLMPDWRRARAAHVSFLLMGMPPVNLLLIGVDRSVWTNILATRLVDVREPVALWTPGQRLVMPPPGRTGTMILHDVDQLSQSDQLYLLDWLERAAGRMQIISTTVAPLLPRVQAGKFIDTLYYRLNTVFLDLTA
jgi:Sigma-54 interaction domain